MVAVIVLIIAAGIVWAGSMKGWFSGGDDSFATASSVTGVVNVERNGVSFELEEGASLPLQAHRSPTAWQDRFDLRS